MLRHLDVAAKSKGHGKLVRACVAVEAGRAVAVTFTGDFFLEPPELLDELSQTLCGATAVDAAERVHAFFARQSHMMLIGAEAEDFAHVVLKALAGPAGPK